MVTQQRRQFAIRKRLAGVGGDRNRTVSPSRGSVNGDDLPSVGGDGDPTAVTSTGKGRIGVAPAASIREPEQNPSDELKERAFARLVGAVEDRDRTLQWTDTAVDKPPEPVDVQASYSHQRSSSASKFTASASASSSIFPISSSVKSERCCLNLLCW